MSTILQTQRDLGKKILGAYLTIPRNVEILEARVAMNSAAETYLRTIYECVGYLTQGWVQEYHDDIKEGLTGFQLGAYQDHIDMEAETDAFLVTNIEVEEGALTCPRCKSQKTFSYTKQVRAADEGTSVFARCYNCQNKWRES